AINVPAIASEAGGDVFGFFWQQAFGVVLASADTLVAYGDAANTRAMVTRRVADAVTEAMSATSSQGGFAGGLAISFAAAGEPDPDVVEVTGEGGFDFGGTAELVAVPAGTYSLDVSTLEIEPPVG